MPKRKRTKEPRPVVSGSAAVPAASQRIDSAQERAAQLFAESIRSHEAADRATREQAAAAADEERRHASLVADKEAAAARLRRLRADGRPRQQMADAESAYRVALAALQEFETGERPHWAPVVPPEVEPEPDVDSPTEDGPHPGSESEPDAG